MTTIIPLEEDVRQLYNMLLKHHARFVGQVTLNRALEAMSIKERELRRVIEGFVETGYLDKVDLSGIVQDPRLNPVFYQLTVKGFLLVAEKPAYGVLPK